MPKASNHLPHCIIYPPRRPHTATVIFLHGLGDLARNLGPDIEELTGHPLLGHVKFVLPTAPLMPITAAQGKVMPSWFDCYSFDHANRNQDEEGIHRSVASIKALISVEEEEYHVPLRRVVVGGLSQGGAVSLLTALTSEKPIAGLFMLSSFIPLRHTISKLSMHSAREYSIFWGHGKKDLQVPHDMWKRLSENFAAEIGITLIHPDLQDVTGELVRNGVNGLRFYSYEDLGHWFNDQEMGDLATWISVVVPAEND